jgi:hypothetical protein
VVKALAGVLVQTRQINELAITPIDDQRAAEKLDRPGNRL